MLSVSLTKSYKLVSARFWAATFCFLSIPLLVPQFVLLRKVTSRQITDTVNFNDIEMLESSQRYWDTAMGKQSPDAEKSQSPSELLISSPTLPEWMKQYFAWHQEQRQSLNETNWQSKRYLIVRCLEIDEKCGGTSDRLQSIPFAIMAANQTQRLLFIKWERPAPLEKFLVPPQGGLDWRIPDWIDGKLNYAKSANIMHSKGVKHFIGDDRMLVDMRFQSHDHGSAYYNAHTSLNESTFEQLYRDCWSILFQPSLPVAALIDKEMKELGLEPNKYVAVHIRSMYRSNKVDDFSMIQNAINCGSELGSPMYIATDSINTTKKAVRYGRQKGGQVAARISEQPPLHIDRGTNFLSRANPDWSKHGPEAFYDIFVDLYLLASARCIAHGVGGYGRWGNLLSQNISCATRHYKSKCQWVNRATTAALE